MVSDNPSLTEVEALTTLPKILIIDDSESDRHTYRRYLESLTDFECQILEAATLAEGLERWRTRSPTLILLEVNLSDGSGLELLERMRKTNQHEKLPVIVLAEQEDARLAVKVMKLGVRDVLFKADITTEFLNSCVVTALQEITRSCGISRDITLQKDCQRQEAEEALRKSEMRFRRVFESDVVGMMFCNFSGEILEANDRFLEIIGYSRDDLSIGYINWAAMTPPEYRQLDLNAVEHLKLHRSIEPWEKVYTHKDGHSVHVLVGVALLSEDDDTCVCVVVDISDRKLIEKNLEESRAKFQRLVDEMGDKFVVFSHNGIEGIVSYVSDGVEVIFGIPKQAAIGKNWAEAVNWLPDELPKAQARLIQMYEGKQAFFQSEMGFIHPNGQLRTLQVSEHPVRNEAGEIIAIEGIVEDISDRKRNEIALKNAHLELERLLTLREETLILREDMSNMIIHDLRNPLTGILLGANIAQQYLIHNPSSDKAINKLNHIIDTGKRMQKMIESLLLMAKLESGKFLLNPLPSDLHELGYKILNDFELMAKNAKVQLLGELPPPGNQVNVDATILQRVIENLISNALKFSPKNSPVVVRLDYLADNHLRITVADRGPGISKDKQERIFEKFEIGEFKKNIPQIGLGLAFCKLAVEAHGGTLAITPNQPQGSIFTVEI